MGLRNLLKRDGGRYLVRRRMVWADGFAEVGSVIRIDDPALARQLVAAGKIVPADAAAQEHLGKPARWTAPRDTSIRPQRPGIFSRQSPWRPIE